MPGFGDTDARLLILGLAPAAHGANRTGRMFTGDRSGDWVYGTLHKFGFASSPESRCRDDGLTLHDAYITAALRCAPPANKPLPTERSNCMPYLLGEFALLQKVRVVVALGKIAFDTYLGTYSIRGLKLPLPRPRFGHEVIYSLPGGITLVGSYHPSQHNTLTGRLTLEMFESVFNTARTLLESRVPGSGVRGRGLEERETTASSLAGKEESSRKEDNGGQGKDGPAGAVAQRGNGR